MRSTKHYSHNTLDVVLVLANETTFHGTTHRSVHPKGGGTSIFPSQWQCHGTALIGIGGGKLIYWHFITALMHPSKQKRTNNELPGCVYEDGSFLKSGVFFPFFAVIESNHRKGMVYGCVFFLSLTFQASLKHRWAKVLRRWEVNSTWRMQYVLEVAMTMTTVSCVLVFVLVAVPIGVGVWSTVAWGECCGNSYFR